MPALRPLARTLAALLTLLPLGCDDATTPAAPTTAPTPARAESRLPSIADFRLVAALPAGRDTTVAFDSAGRAYWAQTDRDRAGVVFTVDETGVPRPTALTSDRVCSTAGEPNGSGQFVSLLGDRENGLLFYFVGRAGRVPLILLGRYDLHTAEIDVIADAHAIGRDSGMGQSIVLAAAKLLPGPTPMLFLQHMDGATLLQLERRKLSPRYATLFDPRGQPLRGGLEPLEPAMVGESLRLLDPALPGIYRVTPEGQMILLGSLPAALDYPSALLPLGPDGPMLLAAARGPVGALPRAGDAPAFTAPALVIRSETTLHAIHGEALRPSGDLPLEPLRLESLARHPRDASLLAYDRTSGQLLRITLR
jgi:hypothetical protein